MAKPIIKNSSFLRLTFKHATKQNYKTKFEKWLELPPGGWIQNAFDAQDVLTNKSIFNYSTKWENKCKHYISGETHKNALIRINSAIWHLFSVVMSIFCNYCNTYSRIILKINLICFFSILRAKHAAVARLSTCVNYVSGSYSDWAEVWTNTRGRSSSWPSSSWPRSVSLSRAPSLRRTWIRFGLRWVLDFILFVSNRNINIIFIFTGWRTFRAWASLHPRPNRRTRHIHTQSATDPSAQRPAEWLLRAAPSSAAGASGNG